ncbi:hypothetical protein AAHE18_17G169700 [Arachis hypogaea]
MGRNGPRPNKQKPYSHPTQFNSPTSMLLKLTPASTFLYSIEKNWAAEFGFLTTLRILLVKQTSIFSLENLHEIITKGYLQCSGGSSELDMEYFSLNHKLAEKNNQKRINLR